MRDAMDYVLAKLDWMEREHIWPTGLRYLWTDAFGVVLLVSLYRQTEDIKWLDKAEALVASVERVLGRRRGLRIGEAPHRDGQYFHYLAMWLFALQRLGEHRPGYREKGIALARDIHRAFVIPGMGVIWKMREDLGGPYPGYGLGAMDAFDGYVSYCLLAEAELGSEIADMRELIEAQYRDLAIDQDLGLGMMLWLAHFCPDEAWAEVHTERSMAALDRLWTQPPGFFARSSRERETRIAFANYGVALGLHAAGAWPERIAAVNAYFETYRSGDEYDREAITHVMACTAHLPGAFLPERRGHASASRSFADIHSQG
jgi:hypothetical protein